MFLGCLLAFIMWAAMMAISWITTCGVVALICFCFSMQFSWLVATGIWLILCLLCGIFGK